MKNVDSKKIVMIILFIVALSMSIGMALLSTSLSINGTATIQMSSWDIHFANLGTVQRTGSATATVPTMTNDSISNYAITFKKPGDSASYTFDIVNDGDYTAQISSLTIPTPTCTGTGANAVTDASNVCNNISYTLKYTETGITPALGDVLGVEETVNMTLSLVYSMNVTKEFLPTAYVTITNLGVNVTYGQMNDDYIPGAGTTSNNYKIYGIRRSLTTSSTSWERQEDSVGLVANASFGQDVEYYSRGAGNYIGVTTEFSLDEGYNDFDYIYPWNTIRSYNYNPTTSTITAWYGDDDFEFDGSNGEVLTYIPEFYYKRYQDVSYEYIYISAYKIDNTYTRSPAFSIGRYLMSGSGTTLHSISGATPRVSISINDSRTYANNLGTNIGLMDYRYMILQILYLVEYADYNAQEKLGGGASNLNYATDTNLQTSSASSGATNTIVVGIDITPSFVVGQEISIGSVRGTADIADHRTITHISYGDGTTEITFSGTAVSIPANSVIFSCTQNTGKTDDLGMKSGAMYKDYQHSVIYRGVEDFYGNVFQFVDGMNVKSVDVLVEGETVTQRRLYVNYNPTTYNATSFTGDYQQVGYGLPVGRGYAQTMGYDSNNPLLAIPTILGGEESTYIPDQFYSENDPTENKIVLMGGGYSYNRYNGPWFWDFYYNAVDIGYNVGGRILLYDRQ